MKTISLSVVALLTGVAAMQVMLKLRLESAQWPGSRTHRFQMLTRKADMVTIRNRDLYGPRSWILTGQQARGFIDGLRFSGVNNYGPVCGNEQYTVSIFNGSDAGVVRINYAPGVGWHAEDIHTRAEWASLTPESQRLFDSLVARPPARPVRH